MIGCISLSDAKTSVEILTIIVAICISVLGAVRYMSYLKQKRIDAAFGFYAKLRWDLKSLRDLLKTSSQKKHNLLYQFSDELSSLDNKKPPQWKIDKFDLLYKNIFEKLHTSDNQISYDIQQKLDSFIEVYEMFSNIGYNIIWRNGEKFSENDTEISQVDGIDEKAKQIISLIEETITAIQDFQSGEKE